MLVSHSGDCTTLVKWYTNIVGSSPITSSKLNNMEHSKYIHTRQFDDIVVKFVDVDKRFACYIPSIDAYFGATWDTMERKAKAFVKAHLQFISEFPNII